MYKRKTAKITSPTGTDLASLIDKLQKNADKVEQNIVETENNHHGDIKKMNEGKQPLYQEVTNNTLLNSMEMLNILDEDAVAASRMQHPQSKMIEEDMKRLRVRVMKLWKDHDRIYQISQSEQVSDPDLRKMIDEKLTSVNNKGFGPDLPTVENEFKEHNIFHSEVEALAPQITADLDSVDGRLYNKLLASSTARQNNLLSLLEYMRRCTVLYWMDQQAEERITYDWSDNNLDYPARKKQYEDFISKCLESKEKTINQLQQDGEELIEQNHPAKNTIRAHMDALHVDWREYLNLLICEENNLKNMDDYHKFHKDAIDTSSLLKRLQTEINQKYNPEFKDMYQVEVLIAELDDQEKAMEHFDERLKALQKRSLQVLPLKYRRETPQKLLPLEAQCEYQTNEGSILRGERYTLLRNNGHKWDVKDANGRTMSAPGVCFIIPPIDPEAVAIADNLINLHKGIKQKVASSKPALQARLAELKKESTGDKQEQQCRQVMSRLVKMEPNDLDKQEKAVHSHVRTPLEQTPSVQDSADRLQDIKWPSVAVQEILLQYLDELDSKEMDLFKWYLTQGIDSFKIPKSRLENKSRCEVVDCMIQHYLSDGAGNLTLLILEKMKQMDLAEKLRKNIGLHPGLDTLQSKHNTEAGTSQKQERCKSGAEFVDKHRAELIRAVSLVDPIADDMKPLIGDAKYQIILKSETTHAQMRKLLDFLTISTLKEKLYQSLKIHEHALVEYLEHSG